MSLLNLPDINVPTQAQNLRFEAREDAMARWSPNVVAAQDHGRTITIYDRIGAAAEGVTAKRIGAALRAIGEQDVTVNINSPGGDFFEGIGIYNLLRQHPAKVTVQVVGGAASAASIIAMAGDEILMGQGSFMMIHNAWAVAVGNRKALKSACDVLLSFDQAMASIYAVRTGQTEEDATVMMDKETWFDAEQALAGGFATGILGPQATSVTKSGSHQALVLPNVQEVAAQLQTLITTIRS